MLSLSIVVCLSLLALPAVAQDAGGNVAEIHCADVKDGGQEKFEAGLKTHMSWHGEQKGSWSWVVWSAMTGPDTGRFCVGSFGHKWEDFDAPDISAEADGANVMTTFGPFMENHEAAYWTGLADVSRPAAEPAPMSTVVMFHVRLGMEEDFTHLVGEFHKAIEKAGVDWKYQWYARVSGGKTGTYALVMPRANFAAFNPSGKTFDEVLEEVYGRKGADALQAQWREVVESSEANLIQSRPDLSYIP